MDEQFFLTLKTMLSGQTLERLLGGACQHDYALAFDGTEETQRGQRKIIRISFGSAHDRERFRAHMRQLASIAPAPQQQRAKFAIRAAADR
jgi:hypothetical protein